MTITYKDAAGAQGMRVAGRLASEVLDFLTPHVKPGITTNELDKLAHDYMIQVQGSIPAPLNYAPNGYNPYPKSICTSVNHQVCHGIPNDKALKLGDIGWAIQKFAESNGFSVVREFCGHGIGQVFHEEPQVLHYGKPGTLEELKPGMTFTIEPMINAGRKDIKELGDGWTIVTRDHSLSAQWEHTILVTDTGYEVLTLSDGSPPLPAFVTTTVC
jgi:methionyl aminopeptidase